MNAEVVVDTYWVNLALGVALPMIVALVTNRLATGQVKTIVLLVLTVVGTVLQTVIANDGRFVVKEMLLYFVITLATAITSHFGILQPLRVTGKAGTLQMLVPGGVGKPVASPTMQNAA